MIFLYVTIALLIIYGFVVLYYWYGWTSIPLYVPPVHPGNTRISVIVPARNEEQNIGLLLQALQAQSYPRHLFDTIVIDDHSTDNTAKAVAQFPGVKLIRLEDDNINSYKKKAIEKGIAAATGELIVTTDADCIPPATWLETIARFKEEKKAVFIAAPVSINCNSSILQVFQAIDFMVLQGITGAVVHKRQMSMCNGANLAYERAAFFEVGGFDGIDQIASGDDMLLMYKIAKKYPDRVHYLKSKDAIVSTLPALSLKEFFQQRIRWASKASKYQDKRILPVLLLVYIFNLLFLVLLVAAFLKVPQLPAGNAVTWLLALVVAKTLMELPLFCSVARFFNKRWAIRFYFFFQPLHILYTIAAGLFGQLGKYEWKGRKVK